MAGRRNRQQPKEPAAIKPGPDELTVAMPLPAALVTDAMWRSGHPPTPEQVHSLLHPRKPDRQQQRDQRMAAEVVRLESTVGTERAKQLVAKVFGRTERTVERALKKYRAHAERHRESYIESLIRLGKLDPT